MNLDIASWLAEPAFSIACLVVVMVCCVGGVVAQQFDDTLLQRLAMGMACLGALVKVLQLMDATAVDPASALVFSSLASYALATALKYWWRWKRAGRPNHPFRRSTDFGSTHGGGQWVEPDDRRRAF